jgi:hypothetical protein
MKPNETLPDPLAADITIYPVGLLRDWQKFIHNPDRAAARSRLRYALRDLASRIRARRWRSVRDYFNGYLAEHADHSGRAGHGWTRGRAYRDLARYLHRDPRDGN